jgi:hypothetical protein
MNKEELRSILHQEYSTENWKKVVNFVFPNVSFLQHPTEIVHSNAKVQCFKQIGNVRLNDGKNLALFEVTVDNQVHIANNRVELRNLVTPFIDQERNHGVLVIYEQGQAEYRFTFTSKSTQFDEESGEFQNIETDAKRFTYVLGKNESCKTAADRFYTLAESKETADIKAIEDAFSVEKLSKQFFKEYKEHYQKFVDYLASKPYFLNTVFKADEKAVRDFVKLLLGRLVFLQFVQKKHWLGIPADSEGWESGDVRFLINSFNNFEHQDLFYSEFLEPLFYQTLNNPHRDHFVFSKTGTKVPYLNGGLFEKDGYETSDVNFPASYFGELLEFFDKYNFTINEYDPQEHEVGIDPEMLGSIFENLLEDNKDKGAFYTPKLIVHYMCQESLIEYLKTYIEQLQLWPESEEQAAKTEATLRRFVTKKIAGGLLNDYDEHLARALKEVKICDPAIGSGAFPMGLLNEIYQCVYVLYNASPDVVGPIWEMEDWAPDVVKKNIIQHSIYGVDIEKGAVDIARLRFWLSLIIDEPEPHALPNLDYKIVVGNSLVSKLGDTIIDIDWKLQDPSLGFFADELVREKSDILKKISREQKEFFNPENDKKKLASDIRNLKIDLLIKQLELMITTKGSEVKPSGSGKTLTDKLNVYLQTMGWKDSIKQLRELKSNPDKSLNFFDWKLDFPEIMNEQVSEQVGFDIVIGNPPYIQLQNDNGKLAKDFETMNYKTFARTGDIYCLFYERGWQLLKENGKLCFITSNKWMRAGYGETTRKFFTENTNPEQLIDFAGVKIFENATVDTNILIFSMNKNRQKTKACKVKKSGINDLSVYFRQNAIDTNFTGADSWVVLTPIEQSIKAKIETVGTPLKDWDINIYRGILTGYNEAFIIDGKKKNELIAEDPKSAEIIRPLLRGRDIKRYSYEFADLYLITTFPSLKIDINQYPAVKQHLLSFGYDRLKQTGEAGARKRTNNKWFETQDSIGYWDDFSKQKIVWKRVGSILRFSYDETGIMALDSTCFAIGKHLKFLVAVLNSKMGHYLMKDAPQTGTGDLLISVQAIEPLKIPIPDANTDKAIEKIIDSILGKLNMALENELNQIIYEMYELSKEEIRFIEYQ